MAHMILSDFARKIPSSLKSALLDTMINLKTIIFNKFLIYLILTIVFAIPKRIVVQY